MQIGGDIYGIKNNEAFGHSVSLSADGSIVAVSAFQQGVAGSVRVYQNISGTWTQIGDNIYGEQSGDWTGYSISLSADGDVIAIGAPSNHGNGGLGNGYTLSGSVKVYKNISGIWTQIGDDIDGEAAGDASGWSISLSSDGSIIAIGAHLNKANGIGAGHVRIYENVSGIWTQIGDDIDGEAAGDQSGESVSLSSDGKTVAIGAYRNSDNGNAAGHVRVYDISNLSSNIFVLENFNIYPNPTSEVLNIKLENNLTLEKATIYNNSGQIVKTAQQNTVDISNLSSGIYFVEVTTNQGKAVKKVVVK